MRSGHSESEPSCSTLKSPNHASLTGNEFPQKSEGSTGFPANDLDERSLRVAPTSLCPTGIPADLTNARKSTNYKARLSLTRFRRTGPFSTGQL